MLRTDQHSAAGERCFNSLCAGDRRFAIMLTFGTEKTKGEGIRGVARNR